MLERFGKLCGWTGDGLAILLIGTAFLLPNYGGNDVWVMRGMFLVAPGIGVFLLGRAIKYVLVPPKGKG